MANYWGNLLYEKLNTYNIDIIYPSDFTFTLEKVFPIYKHTLES